MPKKIWKPGALLAPVPPAMVSCGTLEKPNIITIGWTGIINSNPPLTYISIKPQRFSHGIISATGEFVINLTTDKLVFAADYCGVKSGAQTDKFREMKLNAGPASIIKAPLITQSPVSLECKVRSVTKLGSHDMFMAEIVAVQVDEEFIDKNGKLNLAKCGLAAYAHGEYFTLGKRIGTFGFSVRKKRKKGENPSKK